MRVLCFSFAVFLPLSLPTALAVLPLRDQWQAACRALARGDAASAHSLFGEFEHWYGNEPEVRNPDFREGWLRLSGLAALQAGVHEVAVLRLENWLTEFPKASDFRAFVRFQLATVLRAMGQNEDAVSQFEKFLTEFPELPECALIHWMWADLHLAYSRYAPAREHLLAVLGNKHLPPSGRQLACAALAMLELAEGNQGKAYAWLCHETAATPAPSLRLWRALLAPALVQQLMQAEYFTEAGNATAWLDRPDNLLRSVRTIRNRFGQNRRATVRQAVWNRHWTGQLDRLEKAVARANENAEGTGHLYALRLRSLLKAKEPQKAHVLASALLRSSAEPARAVRPKAYAGIIEACQQLNRWEEANHHADAFLEKFPKDPALPDILFLQAQTTAGQLNFTKAVERTDSLLAAFPEHRARRSWEVAAAGWSLQAGKAAEALSRFTRIRDSAQASWYPFIDFQRARCHASLLENHEAAEGFMKVVNSSTASALLQEQGLVELLKLHMRTVSHHRFETLLARYRKHFPNGLNRLIVGNLAGAFFRQTGRMGAAVKEFDKVASADDPTAQFARGQLSQIHAASRRFDDLRRHALGWIQSCLASSAAVPDQPFSDLQLYQDQLQKPALPGSLLSTMLESLDSSAGIVPALTFLPLLADQWNHYGPLLKVDSLPFGDWIDQRAGDLYLEEEFPAYAGYQLLAAARLAHAGRFDSADARRIRVLQVTSTGMLDPASLHTVAETAHRYDFPQASALLEEFLRRFPEHSLRPQVLLLLADTRRADQSGRANAFLQEILTRWSDSSAYPKASLALARNHLEADEPGEGLRVLDPLLNLPGLPPGQIAEALLLRARAAFMAGEADLALLTCRRLLTLYPDLHDIVDACARLMVEQSLKADDATLQDNAHSLIRQSLPTFLFPDA